MKQVTAGRGVGLGALALASVVALTVSAPASADVVFDTTEILGIVTSATAFITAVGLAVLAMLMIAKGIKWARKAG